MGAHRMTADLARKLLVVKEPIPAHRVADGVSFDSDDDEIDPRQLVPWTWALGPFGSWPCTVAEAEAELAAQPTWYYGESFRLGHVIVWKQGWGYAAKGPDLDTLAVLALAQAVSP